MARTEAADSRKQSDGRNPFERFVEAKDDYPAAARKAAVEGQVKVRLLVDVQGQVSSRSLVTIRPTRSRRHGH